MVTFLTILQVAWPTLASVVVIVVVLLGLLLLMHGDNTGRSRTRRRLPRL